jgi:hypothetical protein
MKQRNVRKLYLVKQMAMLVPDEIGKAMIEDINEVLLDEGGAKAVLYPYNSMKEQIIALWGEATAPKDIASKLCLEEDVVLCVIEDESNYPKEEKQC